MAKSLVTGGAGFIGSHLVDYLLEKGHTVVVLDSLITSHLQNLKHVKDSIEFIEDDIRNFDTCLKASSGCDIIFHQAALGSVPRSLKDPLTSHDINVNGHLNMMKAALENNVQRFVYASSSSVYGDSELLPKVEEKIGKPLSPYAATKKINEIYADIFYKSYNLEVIGLRYFNVFGPRQDPNGPYAAVIPKWVQSILENKSITIYGDGKTSRDFCYVRNVAQANYLAGTISNKEAINQAFNIACHAQTDLNELASQLRTQISEITNNAIAPEPTYEDFRPGDVRHSFADISKAENLLGYKPTHTLAEGLSEALPWYIKNL